VDTARLDTLLAAELEPWDAAGLRRRLAPPGGLDLCTNDYLGLARDPRLVRAARAALEAHGCGSRAARLLGGQHEAHARAEAAAAAWQGSEAALLFPSGYHANLALVSTLAGAGDLVLSDARNHASLVDGARLAPATVEVFRHDDPVDLARRLAHAPAFRRRWIVVESVNSTDGSLAPLEAYARLAAEYDAWLLVDEAHAAGLYGPRGAGRAAELERVAARTVTGGKALGAAGAFVVGGRPAVELLLNRGRTFVFTTAPMPVLAAALEAAVAIVQAEPGRRARAHAAAAGLRAALARAGVRTAAGASPIVSVPLGTPERALGVAGALQAAGYDVRAVRPPTVPEGESALRLVCHADHDPALGEAVAAEVAAALGADLAPVARPRAATPLIVAGTDTDVGKTVVSALLVRDALRRGLAARYLKPLQTGSDDDTRRVRALTGLDEAAAPPPCVALARPASVDQAAHAEGRRVDLEAVRARVRAHLEAEPDACWVLETAGGLLVPLNEREDQADLLRALDAPVVLVARSGLGTLNHTLLSVEALRRRGLALRALVLVGPPHPDNESTLRARLGALPVHALPPLEPLDAAALDGWLAGRDLGALWR
jgi:8-amino-7-oxononanoate synthase